MKHFNTEHIRRRMKDQKGPRTFGPRSTNVNGGKVLGGSGSSVGSNSTKSRMISSPPIRIPVPPPPPRPTFDDDGSDNLVPRRQTSPAKRPEENVINLVDKENVIHRPTTSNDTVSVPSSTFISKETRPRPPPLAVSVTMDEDDDNNVEIKGNNNDDEDFDEIEAARSVSSSSQNRRDNHNNNNNNNNKNDQSAGDASSVWAIMEHYQEEDDEDKSKLQPSDGVSATDHFPLDDDGLSLPTFSVSDQFSSSPSTSGKERIASGGDENKSPKPSPSLKQPKSSSSPVGYTKDIRKIHWNLDPNGSLIQASVYSFEESHITDMDTTNGNEQSISEHHRNHIRSEPRERTLFKSPEQANDGNSDVQASKTATTPKEVHATPAKVHQEFLDEVLNVSDQGDDVSSSQPGSLLQQSMIDSVEQYSAVSMKDPQSTQKSKFTNIADGVVIVTSHSKKSAIEEHVDTSHGNPYMERINELEQNLFDQRMNTDSLQDRLKSRVTELEQALRVTAATPRGTIIQQNPLTTLLERNQTLVKEVRFADQTCVELSSKNTNLEKQIKELKEKVATLEVENGDLRIMNSERASKDAETIERLREELEKDQESSSGIEVGDVLSTIQDAFNQWNLNQTQNELHRDDHSALVGVSTATDIFSEGEKPETADIKYDVSTMNELEKNIYRVVDQLLSEQDENDAKEGKVPQDGIDELSKVRVENEFLRYQLDEVQTKLDSTQNALETEQSRNDELEIQLKRGAETYVRLIEPLEKRLLTVTEATSSLPDGLVDADTRLFGLQKELAHAKASLSAIKRESERLLADKNLTVEMVKNSKDNEELVTMIENSFVRMSEQYKKLESDVSCAVNDLTTRMESMTETISYLQSSLRFDDDNARAGETNSDKKITEGTHTSIEDDEDLLEMMEEARSPRKFEINVPGDLDDITLESLVKSVSVLSPISHADRLREPLEAAIRECQRVRERSSKLKEEIEKHIMSIHHLEGDKKHLTETLRQREEELHALKQTIDFSNQQLEAFDAALKSSEIEKTQSMELQKKEKEALEHDNARLHSETHRLREQEATLTKLLQENEAKIVRLKTELNVMTQAHDDLVSKLTNTERENTERKDAELREVRQSLQTAESDLSKLRKSNQDLLDLHCQDKEELSKLSSKVRELESKQESLYSDLEDRDLEMQCLKEDVRKERAELKSELSQNEQEISSLKTSVSSMKMKYQTELDEKDAIICKIQVLSKIRSDCCEKLRVHGLCEELSSIFSTSDFEIPESTSSAIKEVDGLIGGLPCICAEMEKLSKESLRLSEVETEVNARNDQLELLQTREDELRKQNDELFSLLHQADARVEESLEQVKVMQDTLTEIEEQKNEAVEQARNAKAELQQVRTQSEQSLTEASHNLGRSQGELKEMMEELKATSLSLKNITNERDMASAEVEELSTQLSMKEGEERSLKVANQSLQQKCARLREYIKKLTNKCSEWESSYDRQAKAIERLQDKNRRVVARYKELVDQKREQKRVHQHHRAKWSEERSNLHTVHMQLEDELNEIARELSLPVDGQAPVAN